MNVKERGKNVLVVCYNPTWSKLIISDVCSNSKATEASVNFACQVVYVPRKVTLEVVFAILNFEYLEESYNYWF